MPHPAALPIEALLKDCRKSHTRRSGPGGQHRNKVQTAVVIEHLPTGISAEGSERRSQQQNQQVALQRLRVKLALAVRETPSTEPSDLWQQRIAGKRISVSTDHADYPALLAEVLDMLHGQDFDLAATVVKLAVSKSQIVKFLKTEPAALKLLNDQRQARGLSPLN